MRLIDRRVLALLAVALLVGVCVNLVRSPVEMKRVTAHFPRAVSVYPGTDVRILGVTVGSVRAVIPEGNSVRVEMEYEARRKLPADAKAVIVTPTLVADRFVQLTPVYRGQGAVLADGADIALPDTAVPVELDRIYSSLRSLTQALGPNGVNADGTLDNLLRAGREALDGQGAKGRETIEQLAAAAQTFGDGAGPLFRAVSQLATFTGTLAQNDRLVQAFVKDLTGVSAMLAQESDELDAAVRSVARAVGSVKGFVEDNRDAFVGDVRKLTEVMTTIASETDSIDQAVRVAPVAMGNLLMGFEPISGSQSSRVGIGGNIWDADGLVCAIVQQNPLMPPALKDTACDIIKALVEPVVGNLPFLPPEYASSLPGGRAKGAAAQGGSGTGGGADGGTGAGVGMDTPQGLRLPEVSDVRYSTDDAGGVVALLGGAR